MTDMRKEKMAAVNHMRSDINASYIEQCEAAGLLVIDPDPGEVDELIRRNPNATDAMIERALAARRRKPQMPVVVGAAIWDPAAGLGAFRHAIDPDGILDTSAWYVEGDRVFMPGWGAPYEGFPPGHPVTVTVSMS